MTEQDEATTLVGGTCTWTWNSATKMWVPVSHCDPGYRCGPHPLTKDELIDDLSIQFQQAQEEIGSGGTSGGQGCQSMSDPVFRAWVNYINESTGSRVVVPPIPDDPDKSPLIPDVELACIQAFVSPPQKAAQSDET